MKLRVSDIARRAGVTRFGVGLALCAAGAVALALTPGCSTRNDPGFNPYAPANGDPTVLERAEDAVDALGQALDNLEERLENTVY